MDKQGPLQHLHDQFSSDQNVRAKVLRVNDYVIRFLRLQSGERVNGKSYESLKVIELNSMLDFLGNYAHMFYVGPLTIHKLNYLYSKILEERKADNIGEALYLLRAHLIGEKTVENSLEGMTHLFPKEREALLTGYPNLKQKLDFKKIPDTKKLLIELE